MNSSKRIVILGGCGYIGSRLFQYLKEKKYHVDTVDLEWYGNVINKKNLKVDFKTLNKKFYSKYDVIILLAGHSSVQMCESHPEKSFTNNVNKFIDLLSKITTQKFIYASSSSIYGYTQKMQVTESHDRYYPSNHYDLTKKVIDYYAQLSNVKSYGLRFGTVCGYSPNLRVDLMINKMVHTAKEEGVINIFNPNIYRPILGIEDLCRGIAAVIKKDGQPGIYNLASYNDTILTIAKKVNTTVKNVKINKTSGVKGYNFSVSTEKFEKEFNFVFKETTESIVKSLLKNYNKGTRSIRN